MDYRSYLKKKNLNLLLVSAGLVAALSIILIGASKQYIIDQAERRMQDVILEAEALHQYIQDDMHPVMYQLKQEGRLPIAFYSPEMLSSSYITRNVFKLFNKSREESGLPIVEYKMASANPRNELNRASETERQMLTQFNKDSALQKISGIVKEDGKKYLYYAKPFLRLNENCLKCHGSYESAPHDLKKTYNWEGGFNMEAGIIPAIEIIKTPLTAETKVSSFIAFGILLFGFILLTLIIFINYLTGKNKIIFAQKNEMEKTLSELKQAQSQLVQTEKMASLGILTAGVAHEINNPLNYIQGGYTGLKQYFENKDKVDEKDLPTLLKSIETGIARATEIVQGLNLFSRDNKSFNENCQINVIIDNCLLILHNQTKHRIDIVKNYENQDITIQGNVGKLHQVFINILSNSIQAIENQGAIIIATAIQNENAIITISDTGSGIDSEILKNITDPFFTTKDPGIGTGLGLSISQSIIKNHNGSIKFESEQNKGTTVTITLPINKNYGI